MQSALAKFEKMKIRGHGALLNSYTEKDEGYEAAWEVELARRVEDIESGRVTGKPAKQVFAELRKKYS